MTLGTMLSMFSLFRAVLEPNDDCLIPFPGFPNYYQSIKLLNANAIPYITTAAENYLPTIESLEKLITSKTKCLVICNPGNPTGANFDKKLVEDIVKLTRSKGIYLISDGE